LNVAPHITEVKWLAIVLLYPLHNAVQV